MATDEERSSDVVFYIQYLVLLLYALAWVQFGHVRERMGEENLKPFYLLVGAALCYLGVRAYLVLGGRVSKSWAYVWLSGDLIIISCAVYLTGKINSAAALVYFWPIATSSIQRRPGMTLAVGLCSAVLYTAATWPQDFTTRYLAELGTRLFILALVTILAARYAQTEVARVEEIARLRARATLADYRTRLSQEMHDGIQHYLVSIAARLALAKRLMEKEPGEAARMATDQSLTVRQASDELRYLVRRLRSPVIEQQGFVEALREHLSLFDERSSMSIPLEVEGTVAAVAPEVEQAAFRIVQEALTNAEKYAQATEAHVCLRYQPDLFECVITDNGVGFDISSVADEPEIEGRLGLVSMKQRADSVDGDLKVSSTPGQGTEITFTVPMQGHETASEEDVADA